MVPVAVTVAVTIAVARPHVLVAVREASLDVLSQSRRAGLVALTEASAVLLLLPDAPRFMAVFIARIASARQGPLHPARVASWTVDRIAFGSPPRFT
jgi:hypothetical protein